MQSEVRRRTAQRSTAQHSGARDNSAADTQTTLPHDTHSTAALSGQAEKEMKKKKKKRKLAEKVAQSCTSLQSIAHNIWYKIISGKASCLIDIIVDTGNFVCSQFSDASVTCSYVNIKLKPRQFAWINYYLHFGEGEFFVVLLAGLLRNSAVCLFFSFCFFCFCAASAVH